MIVEMFKIVDNEKKIRFFKKSFLLANFSINVVLRI